LGAGLWVHSQLSGGLRLRNYRAVAGNHTFSSRLSDFACFCGNHSNRGWSRWVNLAGDSLSYCSIACTLYESINTNINYKYPSHLSFAFRPISVFENSPLDVVKTFCSLIPKCSQKQFVLFLRSCGLCE